MTSCPLCGFPFARDWDGTHLPRCIYEIVTERRARVSLPKRDARQLIFVNLEGAEHERD